MLIDPTPRESKWTLDPYHAPAGRELDQFIECYVMGKSSGSNCPKYSTDKEAAETLKAAVESAFGVRMLIGRTRIKRTPWFARYEIDPGNPTEVLAETYPLAICRLAALRAERARSA